MTDEPQRPKSNPPKKQLVLRLPKPFVVRFSTVGDVEVHTLKVRDEAAMRKALPDPASVPDDVVARAFIGVVCHVPMDKPDEPQRLLSPEELQSLTSQDLETFASKFMASDHRTKPGPRGDAPYLHSLAEDVRYERKRSDETYEQLRRSIGGGISQETMELIKQTSILGESLKAQAESFGFVQPHRSLIESLLGPSADVTKQVEAIRGLNSLEQMRELAKSPSLVMPSIPEKYPFPELPPIENTPVGRTATATEKLVDVADDLQSVVHTASAHIASVAQTVISLGVDAGKKRDEDLRHLNRSIRIASYSLYAAIGLGLLSLIFSMASLWVGYRSWQDASAAAKDAAKDVQAQSKNGTADAAAQLQALNEIRDSIRSEMTSVSSGMNAIAEKLKQANPTSDSDKKASAERSNKAK